MEMLQVLPASATPLSDEELRVRLEGAVSGFGAGTQLADVMPFNNHTYAQALAEEFLGAYFPGADVGPGQAFPGYFTFDYEQGGEHRGDAERQLRNGVGLAARLARCVLAWWTLLGRLVSMGTKPRRDGTIVFG